MTRLIAALFLILGVGTAGANELADAEKALNGKDYPQALALYTRLADAGSPVAALRLGEMYWYGEGVPLDRAKGDALFARAAAGGSEAAVAATRLSAQRRQRLADISFWTTGYDGADLVAGQFGCAVPGFPQHSETKRGIGAVDAAFATYTACYNGFIGNLQDALPLGKRIPGDVVVLMSEQELGRAREHLGKVYAAVAARGRLMSEQVVARRAEWMTRTAAYLNTQYFRQAQYLADIERQQRSASETQGWTHKVPEPRTTTTGR